MSSTQCNIIASPPDPTRPPPPPAYLWAAAVVGRRFVHNFIGLHFHHLGAAAEAAAAIAAAVVDVYVDSAAGWLAPNPYSVQPFYSSRTN